MVLYLRSIFLTFLIITLAACSKATLTPIGVDGTILAFGDSLTYGIGVDAEHSYPTVLSRLSQREVINAGVAGETTSQGLSRLESLLENNHYDLLILFEGGNDIF